MRGSITRRGKCSWRLKFDVERVAGARQIRYVTFKGTRREAEAELARLVNAVHTGTHVDPDKITVGEWLHKWLAKQKLSPGSHETATFAVKRLVDELGHVKLQKLRPAHVHDMKLLKRDGTPLATNTARQTRRTLKAALNHAVEIELVHRNVAAVGKRVAAEDTEVDILGAEEITATLEALRGDYLFPIVSLALSTGMRRGELLALRWHEVDLDGAIVRVERSLERTVKLGYRFKAPKTKHGRRTISLPPTAVADLREHRKQQLELRMQLGMGKPDPDALVFCKHDGTNLVPSSVTRSWHQAVKGRWKFHALRHTHASALIADGLDPVLIAARLGHSSPTITMTVYAHQFRKRKTDTTAADAIEKLLGANRVPKPGNGH